MTVTVETTTGRGEGLRIQTPTQVATTHLVVRICESDIAKSLKPVFLLNQRCGSLPTAGDSEREERRKDRKSKKDNKHKKVGSA